MTYIHSSQDFIRALKASSDPPIAGGPTKVEIALHAWINNTFYLPSKGEVIVEWLLTSLLKGKSQSPLTGPVFNLNYWRLLLDVLSDKIASNDKPLKTWLTPLLHRTPLQPILSVFLEKFREIGSPTELAAVTSSCVSILWPISSQKMTLDNLVDLFGLALQKADEGDLVLGVINVGNLIITSYRSSLGNTVNKKKFYFLFLQSFLPRWLRVLSRPTPLSPNHNPEQTQFYQNLYDSGSETLFNLDTLRPLSENRPTDQFSSLFDHLQKALSSPSEAFCVLAMLPRLFLSYVRAVKRHRGTVFSQNSSTNGLAALNEDVNAASMKFFIHCDTALRAPGGDKNQGVTGERVWDARLSMLESVFDEKLFSVQQEDASIALGGIIEDAISVVAHSWQCRDMISSAVRCLHKIGQIDCDLLLPSLPRILPSLLPIPSTDPTPSHFLDLVLEYHAKTRTLNIHIHNLLTSFEASSFPSSKVTEVHTVYESCFSGHLLSRRHLEKVCDAIQTFLTPGQTSRCVESMLLTLNNSWRSFYDAIEGRGNGYERPKKKKRKEESSDHENVMDVDPISKPLDREGTLSAMTFSLQAHLALTVISSLPIQNLNKESAATVRDLISVFQEHTVRKALKKVLKTKQLLPFNEKEKRRRQLLDEGIGWDIQIVAAALLRINHALHVSISLDLEPSADMDRVVERVKEVILKGGGRGNLIAELVLEMFRLLLYHVSAFEVEEGEARQIFESILSYLNASFKPLATTWSGLPCLLTGPSSGALAVLHLILEQWLPLVDHLASPSQLTNLVQLILSCSLDSIPTTMHSNLRSDHLLLRLLQSAEFWEMQNLRSAFLSHLVQITSTPISPIQDTDLVVYRLLLYVPTEFFTKTARSHLVRRAYMTDIQLAKSWSENAGSEQNDERQRMLLHNLIALRLFLKRVIQVVVFERVSDVDLGDFVVHLMSLDCEIEDARNNIFTQSTLDLAGSCFAELLKNCHMHSSTLFRVIISFSQYPVFVRSREGHQSLRSRIIVNLVDQITKLKDSSSLSAECSSSLRSFHTHLSKTLSRQIQTVTPPGIISYSEILTGWCCVLELKKWLGESRSDQSYNLGRHLVSIMAQQKDNEGRLGDIRVSVLAILRSELSLMEGETRQRQLELIITTFIVFYCDSADAARRALDSHISLVFRTLTPDDYLFVLDFLLDSFSSGALTEKKLETGVHLSNLLLRAHPQHTLKHMQVFATRSLDTFANCQIFTSGNISLRLLTLELVAQHCSERPATLRSMDIGSIYLILFRCLEPSEERDENTTREIFHKIVTSLSALLRLRRDLVVTALPHVGLILRRMLLSIRSCRPQLGAAQTAIVMKTQPRWIATKEPLGGQEARLLSRLLETLNAKTIVRSHTVSESQKAESIGKPFSKHAAYVLAAYIEALNDPLCVLSMEIRRELEPGLFTLCEVMGEHSRDALVVGLGSSGKTALKLIWKEYEKQRYIGRG